jgi:hypothetical protein
MATVTTSRPNGKRYFYYRCPKRVQDGKGACSQAKYFVADEVESGAWSLVRGVLTDPERLYADLEHLIEQERKSMRGDPGEETRVWLETLAQLDRRRGGYIDLAAEGIMSREELQGKLAQLEETRETADRELEALRRSQEKLEELRRDKDALLDHYASLTPEALDSLTPEERRQLYRMLRLRVAADADGSVELTGDLVSDAEFSNLGTTYRCWSSWALPNNPGSSFLRRGLESAENDPNEAKASFGELTPCEFAGTPAFCNVRQLRVHTMS